MCGHGFSYDLIDNSVTRSKFMYKELFKRADLKIVMERKQRNFPSVNIKNILKKLIFFVMNYNRSCIQFLCLLFKKTKIVSFLIHIKKLYRTRPKFHKINILLIFSKLNKTS